MFKRHTKCRACGSTSLVKVFSLGNQPLANDFKTVDEAHEGLAPLEILFCTDCTLAQLSVVVDPVLIYSRNYPYVTSSSQTMQQHFESLWSCIKAETNPDTVLEIGSNDGRFLKFCNQRDGVFVVGIDPAENLSRVANDNGVLTINGLFSKETAQKAMDQTLQVDVIVARHVFGHVDDWREFVRNLEMVSHKETLVVLEVPYVLDFLNKAEFDTCYHEHLSYVSIKSVAALLEHSRFQIHKIIRFPIHGGAIAIMLRRRDRNTKPDKSVEEFIRGENITADDWLHFDHTSKSKITDLRGIVSKFISGGRTVCGFGASAKSTVLIQACGFTSEHVQFICDSTANKQGKLSPNTDIPIVCEAELLAKMPDYAIVFCWNFADEVIRRNREYLDRGGHFIIPIPEMRIV